MAEFKSDSSMDYTHQEHNSQPNRDMANGITFHSDDSREETLRKMRTADSIAIPRDVFEKLYLSPQQPAAGHLRKTFGNPTPVALVGFLLAATPNACGGGAIK
jgi:hypothetical protein